MESLSGLAYENVSPAPSHLFPPCFVGNLPELLNNNHSVFPAIRISQCESLNTGHWENEALRVPLCLVSSSRMCPGFSILENMTEDGVRSLFLFQLDFILCNKIYTFDFLFLILPYLCKVNDEQV